MFTFHYQLTEDEYFEYRLQNVYCDKKSRSRMMRQRFLIPVLYMAFAFFVETQRGNPNTFYIVFGIGSIGWIVFYGKLVEWNIRKSIKAMKESGKPPYAEDTHILYDEDKIVASTKDAEMSTGYSIFEKIVVGKNALYLYRNAISAFILPYRIFSGDEEKEAFIQFIKQKTHAGVVDGVAK